MKNILASLLVAGTIAFCSCGSSVKVEEPKTDTIVAVDTVKADTTEAIDTTAKVIEVKKDR